MVSRGLKVDQDANAALDEDGNYILELLGFLKQQHQNATIDKTIERFERLNTAGKSQASAA